jgi:hypothetical protein
MDFGEILSKAWKTIWKHKILWLFGVLAGCGATTGGNASSRGSGGGAPTMPPPNGDWGSSNIISPENQRAIQSFFQRITEIPPWVWIIVVLGVIALAIILSILFLMLGTLGKTGIIKGTGMADEAGEDEKPLSFGKILKGLKPHYWKVLLLTFGYRLASFVIRLLLAIPIAIFVVCTCFVGLFLMIPISWFILGMLEFSIIAIIEEDLGIFQGIGRAWQVIIKNLGNLIVMFLILGLGQIIVGILLALPIFIIPIPLLVELFASGFESFLVGLIITLILGLIITPIVIFLQGVLRSYITASWTLTYRRVTGESALTPTVIETEEPQDENDED